MQMADGASLKKRILMVIVPRIVRWMILLLGLTYRKKWVGHEHLDALKKQGKNWIVATWHNNILMDALLLKKQNLVCLVSASTDGRIAAKILELMGNHTITGSSSRDGAKAMLTMIKRIKGGAIGAITPDGPRGPRYQLQEGIITIAQKSGTPLVPIHIEASRQWVFEKSWDKHKLPKPFATVVIGVGEPFEVPSRLNKEEIMQVKDAFESRMLENAAHVVQIKNRISGNK